MSWSIRGIPNVPGDRMRRSLGKVYRRAWYRRLFAERKGIPNALACLHPGERMDAVEEEYHINKLWSLLLAGTAAIAVLAGTGIGFILDPGERTVTGLDRPGYLEGDRRQTILVQGTEDEGKITVTVSERKYTYEETQQHFEEVAGQLERVIAGENASLDRVEYPLNLVREWPAYGITLEWYSGTPEVLDSTGRIADDHLEGSCLVELKATLRYEEYESIYRCTANVYPPKRDRESLFLAQAEASLSEAQAASKTMEEMNLPDTIAGEQVHYYIPQERPGLLLGGVLLLTAVLLYFWKDEKLMEQAKRRDAQLLADYPAIVSRLTVLLGAGMSATNALAKIAGDYLDRRKQGGPKRYAYEEIAVAIREINSGIPQTKAYERLGSRCRLMPYRKLSSLLIQNIRMGNKKMTGLMKEEASAALEERRQRAKKSGEEAGTKMLGPMTALLAVTVLIVLFPALRSFQM